jgi:hypothetical protein
MRSQPGVMKPSPRGSGGGGRRRGLSEIDPGLPDTLQDHVPGLNLRLDRSPPPTGLPALLRPQQAATQPCLSWSAGSQASTNTGPFKPATV